MPRVTPLSVNYRTHNGILGAAGEIVGMIQEIFPGSIDKLPKDQGYFPGSPPFIVTEREDLLQLLIGGDEEKSQIEFGAHQVIIVRNQAAKKTLPSELRAAIVLTVFEAKGLEFDDVFIIDFFKDSPASEDEWRAISWYMQKWRERHPEEDDGEEHATRLLGSSPRPLRDGVFEGNRTAFGRVNEELKQLYTAFTRARVSLFMYDSDHLKRQPMFHALLRKRLAKKLSMASVNEEIAGENLDLDKDERAQVARIRAKSTTPEEWKKAGLRFEERGLYDAAIKCFENSGDKKLLHKARGLNIVTQLNSQDQQSWDQEQELVIQAGYEFLQNGDRNLLEYCVLSLCKANLYAEATDLAEKLGGDAALKLAKSMEKLAYKMKTPTLPAKQGEQRQRYSRAARLFEGAGSFIDAGRCWEQMGDLEKAVGAVERSEDPIAQNMLQSLVTRLADACRKNEDTPGMMDALSRFSTVDLQLEYLKKYRQVEEAMETLIKHRRYTEAAREMIRNRRNDNSDAEAVFRAAAGLLAQSTEPEDRLDLARCLMAQADATLNTQAAGDDSVQVLLQEAHDVLSKHTKDRAELTMAKLLLGKVKADVSLLGTAYGSFSTIGSTLGRAMTAKAVLEADLAVEFVAYCKHSGRDMDLVDAASDAETVSMTFCSLCSALITMSEGLLADPYLGLVEKQMAGSTMVLVGHMNVSLAHFNASELDMVDPEKLGMDGLGKLTLSNLCEKAVKRSIAAYCVPQIEQLVQSSQTEDAPPQAPPQEEYPWRLELQKPTSGDRWVVSLAERTGQEQTDQHETSTTTD